MQRISEPQMVEAFTRIKISPWVGAGTGTVRISTVLLPGKNAASMVFSIFEISLVSRVQSNPDSIISGRSDFTVHVPQVLPALSLFPEKDLALDEAAISVYSGDLPHLPF